MEIALHWFTEEPFNITPIQTEPLSSLIPFIPIISTLPLNDFIPSHAPSTPLNQITTLSFSPTTSLLSDIQLLLKQGGEKEKKYSELKSKLQKIKEKAIIEKDKIEMLLTNSLQPKDQYYSVLEEKIIATLLKISSLSKEIKEVQSNVMKIKTSKIFTLYYKIFLTRSINSVHLMYNYSALFEANTQNILSLVDAFFSFLRGIINDFNKEITSKISNKEVYLKHTKEYQTIMAYISMNIIFFPIVKYLGGVSHSIVFSGLEDPIAVKQSEEDFLIIKEIMYQFPNFERLKENIKEDKLARETLAMVFKRDFDINKKLYYRSSDLLYDYLLYEN
jgi:hypothetical protein